MGFFIWPYHVFSLLPIIVDLGLVLPGCLQDSQDNRRIYLFVEFERPSCRFYFEVWLKEVLSYCGQPIRLRFQLRRTPRFKLNLYWSLLVHAEIFKNEFHLKNWPRQALRLAMLAQDKLRLGDRVSHSLWRRASLERETGLEPATFALARQRSTNWAIPAYIS